MRYEKVQIFIDAKKWRENLRRTPFLHPQMGQTVWAGELERKKYIFILIRISMNHAEQFLNINIEGTKKIKSDK